MIFEIGIVLAILAVFAVPATMASDNEVYLVPQSSECGPGGTVTVYLMANITDGGTGGMDPTKWGGFQVNVTFDASIGYIADPVKNETGNPDTWDYWDWARYGDSVWVTGAIDYPGGPIGVYKIADLTIEGIDPGTTPLAFGFDYLPRKSNIFDDLGGDLPNQVWTDGTFTCIGPEETFTKDLLAGWNLISLPLTATDMTVGNIIDTSLTGNYDALHKYDASAHNFVSLSSSTDTMENGVGYFIHMTSADTWTYTGSAYIDMNVGLLTGLNMVGWLNCTKGISDGLSSISGNYYYAAGWNAAEQSYETYNPAAPDPDNPDGFNNLFEMERGTGYFISAKTATTLNEGC